MRIPLTLAAATLALAACGRNDSSSALANVPDSAGLTVEAQGGAAEALALDAARPAAMAELQPASLTATPHGLDLATTRERIAALNAGIRDLFAQVEAIAQENGAPGVGDVTTYGPVARCVVPTHCDGGGTATLRLRIARVSALVSGFVLDAQQPDLSWKPVAAGWLRRGAVERRGAGRFALDLDNLRAAASLYPGQGVLLGGFANGPLAKVLRYRALRFTTDSSQWPATTAAFRAFKTEAGVTRVRAAAIADFYGATDDELGLAHVAFAPGVGGRAYAVVTNYADGTGTHGDVPASDTGAAQYFFGRACYAPGATTPRYAEWFLCPRVDGPHDCAVAQGGVGTQVAGDQGATWQTACGLATEPPELAPPVAAQTSDDPATAETGESAAGLVPEATPADPTDVTPPTT